MYILYSIICLVIMLEAVDLINFGFKKYTKYINNKNGTNKQFNMPYIYPSLFIAGGLIRIIFNSKDVGFLILTKECFLFGILLILLWLNVLVIKRWIYRFKDGINDVKTAKNNTKGENLFNFFSKKK